MKNIEKVFLEHGSVAEYKNGDVIFNEGAVCSKVGYIIKGRVKIATYTENEGEVVINLLSKNEVFGDLLLFSSTPNYYGMGICLENTVISYLSKEKVLSLMEKDKMFLTSFLNLITNKGVRLKQINKLYAHKNIEERFTYYIYHVTKSKNNVVKFKSITDIAHILSIPRPSLSRVIHKMKRDGKIDILRHEIIIKK